MIKKILIAGDGNNYFYEQALQDAFIQIGVREVKLFAYGEYFITTNKIQELICKFQNKVGIGFIVDKINEKLVELCDKMEPELVFLYRCRLIYPKTVKIMREKKIMIFMYNNDNPFAKYYPGYFWRHYIKSLPFCDIGFVYRQSNIEDYMESGCNRIEILRSYYIENRNYPLEIIQIKEKVPQVLFLGHYEPDGRKEYIEELTKNGIEVGLPVLWEEKINPLNIIFLKNTAAKYNEMINASKIALVFLSSINQDTYTRRCFEIPATKTLMISVYTKDLASMFEPDKEAVYFQTKAELVQKVMYYLKHDVERKMIVENAYARLLKDGHEVKDRAKYILEKYEEISNPNIY